MTRKLGWLRTACALWVSLLALSGCGHERGKDAEQPAAGSGASGTSGAPARGARGGAGAGGASGTRASRTNGVQQIDEVIDSLTARDRITPSVLEDALGVRLTEMMALLTPYPIYVAEFRDGPFHDVELRPPLDDPPSTAMILILTARETLGIHREDFALRFLGIPGTPSLADNPQRTSTYELKGESGYAIRYTFTQFDDRLLDVVIAHE